MRVSEVSTLKSSLFGSVLGIGTWLLGIDKQIWPRHPQLADFLITIAATVLAGTILSTRRDVV